MREEIIKLLDQYRLKEALSQMTHTSDWQLKNELEALQTSYDLMLQYTSKGMKDPNKVEIYHKNVTHGIRTGRPYPYSRTGNTKLRSLL